MTICYSSEVETCNGFGCFPKLLLRWRASIYKLIWVEFLIYLAAYYFLNLLYLYAMNDNQKKVFKMIVLYCEACSALIPVIFVLGFFVSIVVRRWWGQYLTLPWPDSTAVYVSSLVSGQDERGRLMRRTVMRYICLSHTMVMTMISPRVKRRFPKLENIREAGLINDSEMSIFKKLMDRFGLHCVYWVPIVWASSIIIRARKESRVRDDAAQKTLIDSLNSFRSMLLVLLIYDSISIPLVYTQVVTIAVYTYFLVNVLGTQAIDLPEKDLISYTKPLLSMLGFLFFMGWLKVAESLISPFGDDDDDFELNWLIDRNLQVSYLVVDEMHNEHPELVRDQYWDEISPIKLPYLNSNDPNFANVRYEEPPKYSTAKILPQDPETSTDTTINERIYPNSDISIAAPNYSLISLQEKSPDAVSRPSIVTIDESIHEEYMSSSENDFDRLRQSRELEKLERQKVRFTIPRHSGSIVMSLSETISEEATFEYSEESYNESYN